MNERSGRAADPFLFNYQPADLEIASEFFSTWLPFLSRDLCSHCTTVLSDRIRSLKPAVKSGYEPVNSDEKSNVSTPNNFELVEEKNDYHDDNCDGNSLGSWKDEATGSSEPVLKASTSELTWGSLQTPSHRMSWADMAQEDELEEEEDDYDEESDNKQLGNTNNASGGLRMSNASEKPKLSRDQREYIRFKYIKRKKDFICFERYKGKLVNIVEGLELHAGIFSAVEQKRIVDHVYMLEEKGKRGELKERTYTAPQKWMRGKGRVTIQFGCCYNYVVDKNGNPPGILHNEMVDPLPDLFKVIIRRLIRWHVLPPTCVPDSCIVNIYDEGDCIPPHIDNHDFVRPFCTVSFLSECKILFGLNLKINGPGDFAGAYALPLPVGSVLVLNGNGADVAKHCVPAVPTKRISITFRRMDESKRPNGYIPEPDLQGIQPLSYDVEKNNKINSPKAERYIKRQPFRRASDMETRGSYRRNDFRREVAPESAWSRRGAGNRRNRGVYVDN